MEETLFQWETKHKLQTEFNYILITNGKANEGRKHNKATTSIIIPQPGPKI